MRQIFVNNLRKGIELAILEDGKVVEYYELDSQKQNSIEGNIYIGKVKNVVQGMQSFFVDIGESKNGFLFFNDLEEKQDGVYNKGKLENNDITTKLKQGDNIILQVKKDAIDNKGAKLTTNISLIGRYFILTPNSHFVAITKKITDSNIREEYVRIVKEYLPENYGGIIRTNILEASDDEIKEEIDNLVLKWENINKYNENIKSVEKPKLIYQEKNILYTTIKDVINKELDSIVVNNRKLEKNIIDLVKSVDPLHVKNVKYVKTSNLLDENGLKKKIDKDLQKRIWLNCGGYLVINKTEALTAIDVNTGKYTGKKDLESTIYTVNKQAVIEIIKQLRLRNVGGIIIVDFIDMKDLENKQKILELLQEEAKKDRSKINIKGYTKLNLMEITRKKKNI